MYFERSAKSLLLLVAILLNRQVAAGRHEAVLDGGRLASGVYLVRLEAEGVVHATQKVLLLR